ncbi:MAG: phage tail tube protein [Alphaproteobacteria bacterium]|nr:phage tail tube protein [Alphaproteobacteria bacterium]
MSRAYGANAQLLGQFESTYGTAPSSDFIKFPFISSQLGSEQGLIESDLLGQGRDPAQPMRDVINVDGDVVVPVDLRYIGYWLRALFGAPTTTGTEAPYVHTFKSGATDLPSLALEVGTPEASSYFMNAGVRANSMQVSFERSGGASATINCIAQGEDRASASLGGTPTELVMTRFNQFQGSVKKDGAQLGNVTGAQFTYTNNLEKIETIRDDGKIDGADPTVAAFTGTIDVRFADTTLLDAATDNTAVALSFGYTIDASHSLIFTAHEVYLPKPKLPIEGAGGIQASFNWQAAKNATAGVMLTAILTNDVESYV